MSHITHERVCVNKAIGFECWKLVESTNELTKPQSSYYYSTHLFFFSLIKKPRNDSPKWAAGVTAQPQTRSGSPRQTQICPGGLHVSEGLHTDLSGWDVLRRKVAKLGLL